MVMPQFGARALDCSALHPSLQLHVRPGRDASGNHANLLLLRHRSSTKHSQGAAGIGSGTEIVTGAGTALSENRGSGRCHQALASSGLGRPLSSTATSNSGEKLIIEKLWRDLLSNPAQWWDHREEKEDPKYPDFRHKETRTGLWVNGKQNPAWVEAELAAMPSTSVQQHPFSYNKRLARYVKAKQYEKALDEFHQMHQQGIRPDRFTFTSAIRACAQLGLHALEEGRYVHSLLVEAGHGSNLHITSSLVDMYARCGSIDEAHAEFDRMPTRDVVAWNVIIKGYVKCDQPNRALELALEMQTEGVEPDAVTFVALLNACASLGAIEQGRWVHEQMTHRNLDSGLFVGSSLIDMYARCGLPDEARGIFDRLSTRDVVCWNAMIQGYVKCAEGLKAISLFGQMEGEGVEPNTATFVGLLSACAGVGVGALREGRGFHELVVQKGVDSEVIVANALIHMYSECGSVQEAWRVFTRMGMRTVRSWSGMIDGFLKCGQEKHALELYWEIYRSDVEPDCETFVAALGACTRLVAKREGRRVHESIARRGLEAVPRVSVALIQMYAGCGKIKNAWTVFEGLPERDVGNYNAMIHGCVQCGKGREALDLWEKMEGELVEPDVGTFVGVLDACGTVGAVENGERIHAAIRERGLESDASLRRSLNRMYAKCERYRKMRTVYDKLPRHDEISLLAELNGWELEGL